MNSACGARAGHPAQQRSPSRTTPSHHAAGAAPPRDRPGRPPQQLGSDRVPPPPPEDHLTEGHPACPATADVTTLTALQVQLHDLTAVVTAQQDQLEQMTTAVTAGAPYGRLP